MSSVDLKCPSCGYEEYHDFCEKNDQETEYDLECSSCGEWFTVFNEWIREVNVVGEMCDFCELYQSKCKCGDY